MANKKDHPIGTDKANMRLLIWPERIEVDASGMDKVMFSSTEENMRTQGKEILKTNMQAIKSIINAVESCPIVWEPEKSVVSTKKPQPICPKIFLLLKDLIQLHLHKYVYATMLNILIFHRPLSTAHMNIETGASSTKHSTQEKKLTWPHTTSCSCSSIKTMSILS